MSLIKRSRPPHLNLVGFFLFPSFLLPLMSPFRYVSHLFLTLSSPV